MPRRSSFVRRSCGKLPTATVIIVVAALSVARSSEDQQPVATPAPLPPYHAPQLALVQPASGGSVPQDRPIIVFRFAPGDSSDPVDERSFTVWVDGADRSALFQSARDMAWGALAPSEELPSLAAGAHAIVARIGSIRGACSDVSVSVAVTAATASIAAPADRKRTLLDLLLAAVKKILAP